MHRLAALLLAGSITTFAAPAFAASTPRLDLKAGQVQASLGYIPPIWQQDGSFDLAITDRLSLGGMALHFVMPNNEYSGGGVRSTFKLYDGPVSLGLSVAAGVSHYEMSGLPTLMKTDAYWAQPSVCLAWPLVGTAQTPLVPAHPWVILRASLGPTWQYVYQAPEGQPLGWTLSSWMPNAEAAFPFYRWTWAGSREGTLEAVVGGGSLLSVRGKF